MEGLAFAAGGTHDGIIFERSEQEDRGEVERGSEAAAQTRTAGLGQYRSHDTGEHTSR